MQQRSFELRPLRTYDGAHYFSAYGANTPPAVEEAEEAPPLWRSLFTLVLVIGLSVGLVACYADPEHQVDPFHNNQANNAAGGSGGDGGPDGDYDLVAGGMFECSPGEIYCIDDATLASCTEEYVPEYTDCNEQCVATTDPNSWAIGYSLGCNAAAEDPCQCQYDIVDGGIAACYEGDTFCSGPSTLAICTGGWDYEYIDCDAECAAQGPFGYSAGCDTAAADPCQCRYDIVDGDIAACTPGDLHCLDDATIEICDETNWSWTSKTCARFCYETYGPDSAPGTCDPTNPANICRCTSTNGGQTP